MSVPQPSKSNWYPTRDQLESPDKMMATLKQVLDQHYALADQVNRMSAASAASTTAEKSAPAPATIGPPPGCGPSDTQILGLRVLPVNPTELADGVSLKYVKKSGNFQFIP